MRELDLEPAVLRSFEKALRIQSRRGSSTSSGAPSASGPLSSARSSNASSMGELGVGSKTCRGRLRRLRRRLRVWMQIMWTWLRPVVLARRLLTIYVLALVLAAANIFLPEYFLALDNDDNQVRKPIPP